MMSKLLAACLVLVGSLFFAVAAYDPTYNPLSENPAILEMYCDMEPDAEVFEVKLIGRSLGRSANCEARYTDTQGRHLASHTAIKLTSYLRLKKKALTAQLFTCFQDSPNMNTFYIKVKSVDGSLWADPLRELEPSAWVKKVYTAGAVRAATGIDLLGTPKMIAKEMCGEEANEGV